MQWSTENSLCVDKPRTDHEQDEEVDASIHLHVPPGCLAEAFGTVPGAGNSLLPTGSAHPVPAAACWHLIQALRTKKTPLTTMSTIIAPYDIERCCRAAMAAKPGQSALAVRIVIAASSVAGSTWVSLHDVHSTLKGFKENTYRSGVIADRLKDFGIVDSRVVSCGSFKKIEIKLNCQLFHVSHAHGRVSTRIQSALETYCSQHRSSTHLVGLLLLGMHAYGILDSRKLGEFLQTDREAGFLQTSTLGNLLNQMAAARLLSICRNSDSLSRPFTVIPVEQ